MPTKPNRAGNQQNYVPAGNGDASGEYGDNATGSNIHFKMFKKPEEKVSKARIRKVVDDIGTTTYYGNDEDSNRTWENVKKFYNSDESYKNDGWQLIEKEIDYNEEQIKQKLFDYLDEKIKSDGYTNIFRLISEYKIKLNEEERDAFEYFYSIDKNKSLVNQEVKDLVSQKQSSEYQEKIEAGKKALSKLPKIEGNVTVDENIELVNKANYERTKLDYWNNKNEYKKYHENCQKCAQAFELRMRGYNVEALDRPNSRSKAYAQLDNAGWDMAMYVPKKNEKFEAYGNKWFFGEVNRTMSINDMKPLSNAKSLAQKEDIERIVKETGKGSRFQCSVAWKSGGAHVFNIINDNGVVRFIDAQSGNLDVSNYFDTGRIKPNQTMLIRVDNLELNGNVDMVAKGR